MIDTVNPLAAYMQLSPFAQQSLPTFGQQPQQSWTPPEQPPLPASQPSAVASAISPPQLGQGAPQQLAFNPPGAQTSPLAQALQPQQAAPAAPGAAAGAMTWLDKMMPWLAAAQFIGQQSSQGPTIGGGRGGGFSVPSGGLL